MALFYECMQQCARKALDSADIVRDGDLSPTENKFMNSDSKIFIKIKKRRLPLTVQGMTVSDACSFGISAQQMTFTSY